MTTETVQQDWSAYEVADVEQAGEEVEIGVNLSLLKSADVTAREQEFAKFRVLLDQFVPRDDLSVKRCGRVVEQFKLCAKREEADRKHQLEPHEKEVKRINAEIMPVVKIFTEAARLVTERVNRFLDDRRRAAELEQQRINAEAAKKQALLDRQAQEAKDKAAAAAAAGDMVAATVMENKAVILEQKAAEVIPMQAAQPLRKVELEESTVSFGGAKKVWSLTGWADKKKPFRVIDPALASLVGDLSKLPEGVRFILKHADLNPVYLNASYKGGEKFPAPFVEVNDYSKSTVRG